MKSAAENIDIYINSHPKDIQKILKTVRTAIKETVPQAEEIISYSMPAFKLNGKILVYFAAHANHIGFYPTASPIVAFKEKITKYKSSKGAIQFPVNEPMPVKLIRDIVKFKANEVMIKIKQTGSKSKK